MDQVHRIRELFYEQAKNLYAFAADVFIMNVCLPVVRVVDGLVKKMYNTAD